MKIQISKGSYTGAKNGRNYLVNIIFNGKSLEQFEVYGNRETASKIAKKRCKELLKALEEV